MFKIIVFVLGIVMTFDAVVQELSSSACIEKICIQSENILFTSDDIKQLTTIVQASENAQLKFDQIILKTIIANNVYLLSASKIDYYGVEIVLSKEASKWIILKKIDSIY